jgi:hypothetical protein
LGGFNAALLGSCPGFHPGPGWQGGVAVEELGDNARVESKEVGDAANGITQRAEFADLPGLSVKNGSVG